MPGGHAHVLLHAPGRHMASNALAAAAVARAAHLPITAIVRGLEAFRPVRGRLVTVHTPSDVTVIDDSYNANPDSVRAAVDVLASRPEFGTVSRRMGCGVGLARLVAVSSWKVVDMGGF